MAIYDVSVPIMESMVVWPGDPQPVIELISNRDQGAVANVRRISMSTHSGTHVDAPDHFVEGGASVDQIALKRLVGPCQVLAVEDVNVITAKDLAAVWPKANPRRILLKTKNSQRQLIRDKVFHRDFVALSADGAEFLVAQEVLTVGIDYYSIEPFETPGHPTHMTLLSRDVLVIEGVDLSTVKPGSYRLSCLPLRIVGADGSPARVLLEESV